MKKLMFAVAIAAVTVGCGNNNVPKDEIAYDVNKFSMEGHNYLRFQEKYKGLTQYEMSVIHDPNCPCHQMKTEMVPVKREIHEPEIDPSAKATRKITSTHVTITSDAVPSANTATK